MLARHSGTNNAFTRRLSTNPVSGITKLAGFYLGALLIAYLFEFIQTYLMQWIGQKVMFELRATSSATCSGCTWGSLTPTPWGGW